MKNYKIIITLMFISSISYANEPISIKTIETKIDKLSKNNTQRSQKIIEIEKKVKEYQEWVKELEEG